MLSANDFNWGDPVPGVPSGTDLWTVEVLSAMEAELQGAPDAPDPDAGLDTGEATARPEGEPGGVVLHEVRDAASPESMSESKPESKPEPGPEPEPDLDPALTVGPSSAGADPGGADVEFARFAFEAGPRSVDATSGPESAGAAYTRTGDIADDEDAGFFDAMFGWLFDLVTAIFGSGSGSGDVAGGPDDMVPDDVVPDVVPDEEVPEEVEPEAPAVLTDDVVFIEYLPAIAVEENGPDDGMADDQPGAGDDLAFLL